MAGFRLRRRALLPAGAAVLAGRFVTARKVDCRGDATQDGAGDADAQNLDCEDSQACQILATCWCGCPPWLPRPGSTSGDGLVGWGEAARLTIPAGADRFAAGEQWLADLFATARHQTTRYNVPGTGLVAFGSFTFDPAADGSVLIVPRSSSWPGATGSRG